MCMTEDGGYTIPCADPSYPVPTTAGALSIVHNTMFHAKNVDLIELVARAHLDVNRLWLQFRKELYATGQQDEYAEEYTEEDYKQAMLYIVACFEYAGVLEEAVDLFIRLAKEQAQTG